MDINLYEQTCDVCKQTKCEGCKYAGKDYVDRSEDVIEDIPDDMWFLLSHNNLKKGGIKNDRLHVSRIPDRV